MLLYLRERDQVPRFAGSRSFEYEFGHRWKELYQMERARRDQLERELKEARETLNSDMDMAYQDYQAQLLREGSSVTELFALSASHRHRLHP